MINGKTRRELGQNRVTRRTALGGLAATTAALAAPGRLSAQEQTLRWWSPQSSPEQLAAYKFQIARSRPRIPASRSLRERPRMRAIAPQLAAAFASGEVPNLVTHLPSFAVSDYWRNGLLEPFNDVIEAVGPENYYRGANKIYEIDGPVSPAAASATRPPTCCGCART